MNHNTPLPPLSPRPLRHLSEVHRRVMTAAPAPRARRLGRRGERAVPARRPLAAAPPGRLPAPPGPADQRGAAARGADVRGPGGAPPGVPAQPGADGAAPPGVRGGDDHRPGGADAARLLARLPRCPPWTGSTSWSRGCAGCARRAARASSAASPLPARRAGHRRAGRAGRRAPWPTRSADSTDAGAVRRLLTEAVRGGHCEPAAVVRELNEARLLSRPHVVDAVDSLLAEGRAIAEDRLYRMVREYGLPDPVWNVDLRLPGGPHLGGLDAYWPEQAVAVELDTRAPPAGRRRPVVGVRPQARAPGAARHHGRPHHAQEAPGRDGAAGGGGPYGPDGVGRPGSGRVCRGAAPVVTDPGQDQEGRGGATAPGSRGPSSSRACGARTGRAARGGGCPRRRGPAGPRTTRSSSYG